jgi:hypothetical protein
MLYHAHRFLSTLTGSSLQPHQFISPHPHRFIYPPSPVHLSTLTCSSTQGWDSYFSFEAINIIASLLKNEAINIIATNFKNVAIIASLLLKFR